MSEGEQVALSERDSQMAEKGKSPEKSQWEKENPRTSLILAELREKQEPATLYTLLSFLDMREADMKDRKTEAKSIEGLNSVRESTLNIIGQKNAIVPQDVERVSEYLQDVSSVWRDKAATTEDSITRNLAEANVDIFDGFLTILTEDALYKNAKPFYDEVPLVPDHAREVLKQLDHQEISAETIDTFLEESAKDNEKQKKEPKWANLEIAVKTAREFYKTQANTKRKNGENVICVTLEDGVIKSKPSWTTNTEADPDNGVYLFNPEGYAQNPLFFGTAAKATDAFEKRDQRVQAAREALVKIEKNLELAPDDELAIYQIIEEHKNYLAQQNEGGPQLGEMVTLEKMTAFLDKKLGKEKKVEELTDEDRAAMEDTENMFKMFSEQVKAAKEARQQPEVAAAA
ncbi:MAG TPA: hypothetical protein VLF93_05620 [Candidatus Saccharimonadales bacterium]|nr:hypothetical protein [Candidatus Saccharimonadales bacterium]